MVLVFWFKRVTVSRAGPLAVLLLLRVAPARAQTNVPPASADSARRLAEVEVVGQTRLTNKTELSADISASPASVSLMGRDYVAKQPFVSYGDLLRPIAGVNVSNYQLGGVGYGIQMRGYTVTEHARDIVFTIDNVPQNQGSSIQANGYVDLNPLIPETIRRLEVLRGPFSPFYGDHALGGTISFETEDKLPSSITVSGGLYGSLRGLGTLGFGRNGRSGYVALEGYRTDGYRANNAEQRLNGLVKYAFPLLRGTASLRAQAFGSDFGSPAYLSQAKIDSGTVDRRAAISPTDGGTTRQQNVVFSYRGSDPTNFGSATVYVQHHDFVRIRTIVTGGPQRREEDNRTWFGGDLRRTRTTTWGRLPVLIVAGVSFRGDAIAITRFATVDRRPISQNRDRQIQTYTPSAYAQAQLRPTERLKLTLSARYDRLFYAITTGPADTEAPNVTVKPNTGVFSPKAGLAYAVTRNVTVFANVARGFKAPSGYEENLFNPNLSVSKLTSYELGIGGDDANGRLHGLLSAYLSDQTGEIQTDALGVLTNFGNTRRSGIEAEGRVRLTQRGGLTLFGNVTRVVAKLRNGGSDNQYVTNTPEYLATLGFDTDFGAAPSANGRLLLSVYDQLIGPKNLNTAGTIRSEAFHRLAGKLTYSRRNWANIRLFAEGSVYLGNGALNEVSFLSGGQLLTAPQPPVNLRGGVRVPF